jgi:hypothetical protein
MAHLWTDRGGTWTAVCLDADLVVFDGEAWRVPGCAREALSSEVAVVGARGDGDRQWILVSRGATLRVNGADLPLEIRVLADRDEIAIRDATFYFSTEDLPRLAAFDGPEPVRCPRCKTAIEPGSVSVVCPGCRARLHQDEALGKACWLYGPTCPICGRSTSLDQSYAWTPAEL